MSWERLVSVADLDSKPAVVRSGSRQLAVFKVGDDVFAIDNRCPHEGYPLAEGSIDGDCVLTCNWHNWKFRLDDGECILGGDHVRSYAVRVDDGDVWADLSDPPIEEVEAKILRGLAGGMERRDFGRICREISRLKLSGINPLSAVKFAITSTYDRYEFGTTHAFAAAADWLALSRELDGDWERQLVCLAEPVDHMAFDSLRCPHYGFPEPGDEAYSDAALLEAIECEDRSRAESLAARAIADGLGWDELEEALATAALAHFNDFGHSLIYVLKSQELHAALGSSVGPGLILACVRSLCYATREDLIPEFSGYAAALESLPERNHGSRESIDASEFFPASIRQALQRTSDALQKHTVESVYDAMLIGLASNVLYFDTSYDERWDRPVVDNISWLNGSHGITFANAARRLCGKYPQLWGAGLLQMACFIGRNRKAIDQSIDVAEWFVADRSGFRAAVIEQILDHGFRDPIFSAHVIKTPFAVFDELATASDECSRLLLAAVNRMLHSNFKQKHVRRLARQAFQLVERDYSDSSKE